MRSKVDIYIKFSKESIDTLHDALEDLDGLASPWEMVEQLTEIRLILEPFLYLSNKIGEGIDSADDGVFDARYSRNVIEDWLADNGVDDEEIQEILG